MNFKDRVDEKVFTQRKHGFTLENIDGRWDIKFSNLAGRHTGGEFDDPDKDPQRSIVIWFDDDEMAKALQDADFLVGRAKDTWHKNSDGQPINVERYFIKFVAYPKLSLNPRTGREELSPKIVTITPDIKKTLTREEFGNVDASYLGNIDISFRAYKYKPNRPAVAAINQLWCEIDTTAGGRNDFEDDALEQKYADIPFTDEE